MAHGAGRCESQAPKAWAEAGRGHVLLCVASPYRVEHQRSHHVVCVGGRVAKIHRWSDRRAQGVNCSIRRVEGLDVVEVVWDSPHFDHTITVIGCEALDFGPAMPVVRNLLHFRLLACG